MKNVIEKLKIEADSSKIGRMKREIYFKKCVEKLFKNIINDYNKNDYDKHFVQYSNVICDGPIVVD